MVRRGVDRKKVDLVSAHREASCHSARYYWKRTTSTRKHCFLILNLEYLPDIIGNATNQQESSCSIILNPEYLPDIIGNAQHQQESIVF